MRFIITLLLVFTGFTAFAQTEFKKSFEHFEISSGDSKNNYIITLPQQEIVRIAGQMQGNSGFGPTFDYFGATLIIDQMDTLPNGTILAIVRREDGKKFYGHLPTLRAVLKPAQQLVNTATSN